MYGNPPDLPQLGRLGDCDRRELCIRKLLYRAYADLGCSQHIIELGASRSHRWRQQLTLLRLAFGGRAWWLYGTLIHPKVILYAAQCGVGSKTVKFGEDAGSEERSVATTICEKHPDWLNSAGSYGDGTELHHVLLAARRNVVRWRPLSGAPKMHSNPNSRQRLQYFIPPRTRRQSIDALFCMWGAVSYCYMTRAVIAACLRRSILVLPMSACTVGGSVETASDWSGSNATEPDDGASSGEGSPVDETPGETDDGSCDDIEYPLADMAGYRGEESGGSSDDEGWCVPHERTPACCKQPALALEELFCPSGISHVETVVSAAEFIFVSGYSASGRLSVFRVDPDSGEYEKLDDPPGSVTASDGDIVYFLVWPNMLHSIDANSLEPGPIIRLGDEGYNAIGFTDEHLYIYGGAGISRMPKDGGETEVLAEFEDSGTGGMSVADDGVYWSEFTDGGIALRRMDFDGKHVEKIFYEPISGNWGSYPHVIGDDLFMPISSSCGDPYEEWDVLRVSGDGSSTTVVTENVRHYSFETTEDAVFNVVELDELGDAPGLQFAIRHDIARDCVEVLQQVELSGTEFFSLFPAGGAVYVHTSTIDSACLYVFREAVD